MVGVVRHCCGVLVAAALAVACGTEDPSGDDAAGPDPASARAAADARRGELLSFACQACHALTPAGGPDIGPTLYSVFGRSAAAVPDFPYSDALRDAEFAWTPERLDAWLQAPTDYLPGTTMVFAGYGDAEDRRVLIEWLQTATAPIEH